MVTKGKEDIELKYLIYIDDDEEDRSLFSEVLEQMCATTKLVLFKNAHEFVEYLNMKEDHKQLPHSIVCDMYMPLMNGIELLQFLKNEPRWQHIPVFAFSTSCSTTESQNLLSAGATAFFTKPNSYDELKAAIEKILVLHNNT